MKTLKKKRRKNGGRNAAKLIPIRETSTEFSPRRANSYPPERVARRCNAQTSGSLVQTCTLARCYLLGFILHRHIGTVRYVLEYSTYAFVYDSFTYHCRQCLYSSRARELRTDPEHPTRTPAHVSVIRSGGRKRRCSYLDTRQPGPFYGPNPLPFSRKGSWRW